METSSHLYRNPGREKISVEKSPEQEVTASEPDALAETVPLSARPLLGSSSEPNLPAAARKLAPGLQNEQKSPSLPREDSFLVYSPVFSPSDQLLHTVPTPHGSLSSPNQHPAVSKSFQLVNISMQKSLTSVPESQSVPESASPGFGDLLSSSDIEYGKLAMSDDKKAKASAEDFEEQSDDNYAVEQLSIASDQSQTRTVSPPSDLFFSAAMDAPSPYVKKPSLPPFMSQVPGIPAHLKPLLGAQPSNSLEKSTVSSIPDVVRQDVGPSAISTSSITKGRANPFDAGYHQGEIQKVHPQGRPDALAPQSQLPIASFRGEYIPPLKAQSTDTALVHHPSSAPLRSLVLTEGHGSNVASAHTASPVTPIVQDNDEVARLTKEVKELRQVKANLEGQLESVVHECQSTLQQRSVLHSELARTQVQLHALQKATHEEGSDDWKGNSPVDDDQEDGIGRQESLVEEQKQELALLHKQLETERNRAGKLEHDLVQSKRECANRAQEIIQLQSAMNSLKLDFKAKENEVEQLTQNVATTQSSLKRMESSKVWLHDRLREAVQAKLQLQEEVRSARAKSIAQAIQLNELSKQKQLCQDEMDDLLKGMFNDKAKLLSELEVIEADVALKQDTFTKMEAQKVHTEQKLSSKVLESRMLNEEVAQLKSRISELEQKLSEVGGLGKSRLLQLQAAEHEKDMLTIDLQQQKGIVNGMKEDLDQLTLGAVAQQEKISQLETALADKEGVVQELRDSSQILQNELDAVKEAKLAVENELVEAAETVALMETQVSSAQVQAKQANAQASSMHAQLKEQQATMDKLADQVSRKEEELNKQSIELGVLETQSQEMNRELDFLQGRLEAMAGKSKHNMEQKEQEIQSLAAELEKALGEVEDLKVCNGKINRQVEKLREENALQSGQLEAIATSNTVQDFQKVLAEKAALEAELGSLRVSHQHETLKSRGRILHLETALRDSKRKARQEVSELGRNLEWSQDQLQRTQEALSEAEAELQKAKAMIHTPVPILPDTDESKVLKQELQQKENQFQQILSDSKQVQEKNEDLQRRLEESIREVAELEQSSSLAVQQLKQNAAKVEEELQHEIHTQVLESERLKGRLIGVTTAQQCTRQHASSLEMALAQKEAQVGELERKMNVVMAEREEKFLEYEQQLSTCRDENSTLKAELEQMRTDRLLDKQHWKGLQTKLEEQSEELSHHTSVEEDSELRRRSEELQQLNDDLQSEVKALKHQVALSSLSEQAMQKELQEKTEVSILLQDELQLSRSQTQQAREELNQLQQYLSMLKEEQSVRSDSVMQRDADGLHGIGASGVDGTDYQFPNTMPQKWQSEEYTPGPIFEAQFQEMSSRVEKARAEGKECAERRCHGEIDVLKSELGNKSKTLGSLRSYLSSLRSEMNQLQRRIGDHSASFTSSQQATREIESKIERLQDFSVGSDSHLSSTLNSED